MNIKWNLRMTDKARMRADMIERAKEVLWLSMHKMQEIAINRCAVDTGKLRSSIQLYPKEKGSLEYILADGVDYGIHVEFGTEPDRRMPPIDPLKGWSRRVLGDEGLAFAVARKIASEGTPAQPFFRPAQLEVSTVWLPIFWKQALSKSQ